jgi:hypothetical protein
MFTLAVPEHGLHSLISHLYGTRAFNFEEINLVFFFMWAPFLFTTELLNFFLKQQEIPHG